MLPMLVMLMIYLTKKREKIIKDMGECLKVVKIREPALMMMMMMMMRMMTQTSINAEKRHHG